MLERLIAWVLNTYIGEYVENLNTYQLTIGIFQGQVELENLPLRRNALKRLNFPVEVKSGFIGKVQLKVPVTRLRSEQWVITLDKLYLVAGPLKSSDVSEDVAKSQQVSEDAKKSQLKALEENWLMKMKLLDEAAPQAKSYTWLSYGTSLVTSIVENLQLQINDVHIRYEDDVTIPGCSFACGVNIQSISAQSADSSWLPRFVSCTDGDTMNKIVSIVGLSTYWDTKASMIGGLSRPELEEYFLQDLSMTSAVDNSAKQHEYILQPVSAHVKLSRHRSVLPLRTLDQSRFSVEITLDALPLQFTDEQFRGILSMTAEVKRHLRRQRYEQFRPACGCSGNARTWWKFAIDAHVHFIKERNEHLSWKFVLSRSRDNVKYVQAYKSMLKLGIRYVSRAEKDVLDDVEQRFTFDELRILREIVYERLMDEHQQTSAAKSATGVIEPFATGAVADDSTPPPARWTWLQGWFPAWSGWYSSSSSGLDEQLPVPNEIADNVSSSADAEKQLEQDILDVLSDSADNSSVLCQDVVFARLSFCLNNGQFVLLRLPQAAKSASGSSDSLTSSLKTLIELECSSIKMNFESRPKFKSFKFGVDIEDFYLRDKAVKNSLMPVLIQPLNKDILNCSGNMSSSLPIVDNDTTLFKLIYEKKPFRTKADYKVTVESKPLNIVYSPFLVSELIEFFSTKQLKCSDYDLELEIATAAARRHFEHLKKQTQQEMKQTIDEMLDTNRKSKVKVNRWLFSLDICAPHITVPENVTDPNSAVVVFDLGRLQFCNQQPQQPTVVESSNIGDQSSDDEDLFVTPLSSPPSEISDEVITVDKSIISDTNTSALSASSLLDKFYEVYTLNLSDLQVMVGRTSENWKQVRNKGANLHHIVDKFNILLKLDRRLIVTEDPSCPQVRLSGKVPSITLHLSDTKILAIRRCVKHLLTSDNSANVPPTDSQTSQSHTADENASFTGQGSYSKILKSAVDYRSASAEAVILSANFGIDRLTLAVQSRGRSLVELQIANLIASCIRKRFETSFGFVVHSLLVVDALQTLGPDYELLVASHRNISLDPRSGRIKDSCPNSPDRVPSPGPPSELNASSSSVSFAQQQNKIPSNTNFYASQPAAGFDARSVTDALALIDDSALIRVSVDFVDLSGAAEPNEEKSLCSINIDFNSLDVIANQQTVVELVAFVQQVMPPSAATTAAAAATQTHSAEEVQTSSNILPASDTRKELLANFHCLNILLIRTEKKIPPQIAHRVALVTLSDARLQASLAVSFSVEGSLSGLQVLDLRQEGNRYRKVLCMGNMHSDYELVTSSMSSNAAASYDTDAFSVKLKRTAATRSEDGTVDSFEKMMVEMRLASVTYFHVPQLLAELSMCLTDYHAFLKRVTASLSNTAAELAMGLVMAKPSDNFSGSFWHVELASSRMDLSHRLAMTMSELDLPVSGEEIVENEVSNIFLQLDIQVESPVIMIPQRTDSPDVLVLRLGKIVIYNEVEVVADVVHSLDMIVLEILNASMSSVNLDSQKGIPHRELASAKTDILCNTSLEMKICRNCQGSSVALFECFTEEEHASFMGPGMNQVMCTGEVTTPIRVILTKHSFEQILKTLDNITPADTNQRTVRTSQAELITPKDNGSSSAAVAPTIEHQQESRSRHSSQTQHASLVIIGNFVLPTLNVQMIADMAEGGPDRGLVELQLDNFTVDVIAREGVKGLDIRLQSLVMEDLMQDVSSPYRRIMISKGISRSRKSTHMNSNSFMSQSCPASCSSAATMMMSPPVMPSSLPSSFRHDIENQFDLAGFSSRRRVRILLDATKSGEKKNKAEQVDNDDHDDPSDNPLVHVKVKLINRKAPEYTAYYNSINRFITVAFNCLETTVNLQTWALLLEFLGISGKAQDPENFTQTALQQKLEMQQSLTAELPAVGQIGDDEVVNTALNLSVTSLSLVLNKPAYELAKAKVASVEAHVVARDGNLTVSGKLGSLMLSDTSPHGKLYKDRFYTTGDQAVNFDIFKYGTPDPDLLREYDVRVKLRMSEVWYVHTQRFMQEIVAYCQNFNQLQDLLGRNRAASMGRIISDRVYHNARVSLDVSANAPVILIPHSSRTKDILVLNLGRLRVSNVFLRDKRNEGTPDDDVVKKTFDRYDVMNQSIYGSLDEDWRTTSMRRSRQSSNSSDAVPSEAVLSSFYSALGTDSLSPVSSTIVQSMCNGQCETVTQFSAANSVVTSTVADAKTSSYKVADDYRCLLDTMTVELCDIELFSAQYGEHSDGNVKECDMIFPSYIVRRDSGDILKEKCRLGLQVERNLDVDICRSVPDISISGKLSSVHLSINSLQYKLVRGLLAHNFGEQLEEFRSNLMPHLKNSKSQQLPTGEIAKGLSIDIGLEGVRVELMVDRGNQKQSPLSLAQFDLQRSQLKFESRTDGSKDIDFVSHAIVISDTRFTSEPVNVRPNVFTDIVKPSTSRKDPSALQLELHCRTRTDSNQYKVILNNMRVIGVFDWLLATKAFLASSFDDPFKKRAAGKDDPDLSTGKPVSPGIVAMNQGSILTKRVTVEERKETSFEFCLNVIESELVVVENPANWDTNAIILKGTAIMAYRPTLKRPLSCSLASLELFSCSLASEDDTALSIIDPTSMTIDLNTVGGKGQEKFRLRTPTTLGLMTAAVSDEDLPTLEITFQLLNIRLSYNDICLFAAIFNSVPRQLIQTYDINPPKNVSCISRHLSKLEELGFAAADCKQALIVAEGNLDKAAEYLKRNATSTVQKPAASRGLRVSGFEIKYASISVCLIDDCQDSDVPLAEIVLTDLNLTHRFYPQNEGNCLMSVTADYYNRLLSGWEPFVEKWDCEVRWAQLVQENEKKLTLNVMGSKDSLLNVNVTNCLIDQFRQTQSKWTEEYNRMRSIGKDSVAMYNSRRRAPFVPFVLCNDTGCQLKFATVGRALTKSGDGGTTPHKGSPTTAAMKWKTVDPGSKVQFIIDEHEKIRHKHTADLQVHQLLVQVQGWNEVVPISVDKVGVYYRQAEAGKDNSSKVFQELPPARIVFEIEIEESARKSISVRSSLMLNNQLEDAIEVRLINASSTDKECKFRVEPSAKVPIPLKFVYADMFVRPVNWSLDWCQKPITWQNSAEETTFTDNTCHMLGGETDAYRFCVSVQKMPFKDAKSAYGKTWPLPGHVMTIAAPVRIVSLLPIDMQYTIQLSGWRPIEGTVKAGKHASLVTVDISQPIEATVTLESFPHCRPMVIPPGTTDFQTKLSLTDIENRVLELNVAVKSGKAGSLVLSIGAPYWLVNKSGLPLIFKQDGCTTAAGQFAEHEIARSVTPLLFCFAEKDKYELCAMKLGKSVHGPNAFPQWCQRFLLERGTAVRQLHVSSNDSRPDRVYNIGIEVRQGRGRYADTNIVTFMPRYQLVNCSAHKLAYAQRYMTSDPLKRNEFLAATPNCVLPYHWPRIDLDNLLCVRLMDKTTCNWSGGFQIDRVDSFHINMREEGNRCLFLQVDIVLQGATFVVSFSDTDQMPPPYRIDNFAEVPVLFHQSAVTTDQLKTWIKPRISIPYSWDEPTEPPQITLKVASGTDAVYDLNTVGIGERLYYENFIYIAFTHTFQSPAAAAGQSPNAAAAIGRLAAGYRGFFESQELVLDVIDMRVVIKKKEPGKRSQLWRMSSGGMLQHEGSSTPRDPRSRSARSTSMCYVLDIKDIALQPNLEVPLTLRKIDDLRRSTQVWKFKNGKLCLGDTSLCVQARNGRFGLRDGGEVVLGQSPPTQMSLKVAPEVEPEMAVDRQKSHAGSGVLCVKVLNDGPTRVLQITDIQHEQYKGTVVDDWLVVDTTAAKPDLDVEPGQTSSGTESAQHAAGSAFNIELMFALPKGVGISLIDRTPEELIYATLSGLTVEYVSINDEKIIHVDVQSFQIDNQLFDSCKPVVLFVVPTTTPSREFESDVKTSLSVGIHRLPSRNWNANIFKHLLVTLKPVTLQVEEKLLWKLLNFFGFGKPDAEVDNVDESYTGSWRTALSTTGQCRRHYFGKIKVSCEYVNLSMLTSANLPSDLKLIKQSLGIPLIRFEDAKVEIQPFSKVHLFETTDFLLDSVRLHYKHELMNQAANILGSIDFLGNPLGLFNDVAEGVSGLLEGNVMGLIKNATHGVTNSYAKVVGTLSDNIGLMTLDKGHQQRRLQIMNATNDSRQIVPMRAGFNSLMHGVVGGIVSIPKQAYVGARQDGLVGLVGGLGKGVVGLVAKPVAGVLDFTSGAASMLRDTSRGDQHWRPVRVRRPRCCYGHGGLLPSYRETDAEAQEVLLQRNKYDYGEKLLTVQVLRESLKDDMRLLISTRMLYFVSHKYDSEILRVSFSKLLDCQCKNYGGKYYVELTVETGPVSSSPSVMPEVQKKRPEVRCDTQSVAESVVQHVLYAKNLYEEMKCTLKATSTSSS